MECRLNFVLASRPLIPPPKRPSACRNQATTTLTQGGDGHGPTDAQIAQRLLDVVDVGVRVAGAAAARVVQAAARKLGLGVGRCGGITVVQRFGSACELNVHFHTLVFDGVYVDDASTGRPQFRPLPAPTAAELEGVTRAVVRRVRRALRRAGLLDDEVLADTVNAQPELAGLIAKSVRFSKGRVVDSRLARSPSVGVCGVDGFNLHVGVAIGARGWPP